MNNEKEIRAAIGSLGLAINVLIKARKVMIEMIQSDMMDIIVCEVANYYNLDLANMK